MVRSKKLIEHQALDSLGYEVVQDAIIYVGSSSVFVSNRDKRFDQKYSTKITNWPYDLSPHHKIVVADIRIRKFSAEVYIETIHDYYQYHLDGDYNPDL